MKDMMKLIQAEMTLMEGKDLVLGMNYPANSVLECCENAKAHLEETIQRIKENPQEWEREGDIVEGLAKRYQIEVKVVRLTDNYLHERNKEISGL